MPIRRLLVFSFVCCLFFACKPSITMRSASWSTWSGGQPGVGGVNYYFILNNPNEHSFDLRQLLIDGEVMDSGEVIIQGDSISITSIRSISQSQPTIDNPSPQRETLYATPPITGTIIGTARNKEITITTSTFEKKPTTRVPLPPRRQ